jgi:ASC-1-like (ASCH) protein
LPEYQGKGIGKKLFRKALEWMDPDAEIEVAAYNEKAIKFYQSFGYRVTQKKIEDHKFTEEVKIPSVLMRKGGIEFFENDRQIFNRIKTGEKTIEVRSLDDPSSPKAFYNNLKVGNKLAIFCGEEELVKTVIRVSKYRSVDDLFKTEDVENIFGKDVSEEEAKAQLLKFPGYKERIEKFGLVAFELK